MPISDVMGKKAGLGSSHRCAQWGPANAPHAEEESHPNPITSTTPHVPFAEGEASQLPSGRRGLPDQSCHSPCIKPWLQVILLSFCVRKRLQPSSQSRHLCHRAEPWQGPDEAQSPPIRCHGHPTKPLQEMPLAGCPIPLGLPFTGSSRMPLLS